jgi:hypothetical protein
MAMWQGYGGGPYGIAVESTFGRLDEVLPPRFEGALMGEIHLGRVRYCDYTSDSVRLHEEFNVYAPFVSKSMPYRHESEVRAVFVDLNYLKDLTNSPPGHFVKVDLPHLVRAVTISPLAPSWFSSEIRTLCESHQLNVEVRQSKVFSKPIY